MTNIYYSDVKGNFLKISNFKLADCHKRRYLKLFLMIYENFCKYDEKMLYILKNGKKWAIRYCVNSKVNAYIACESNDICLAKSDNDFVFDYLARLYFGKRICIHKTNNSSNKQLTVKGGYE